MAQKYVDADPRILRAIAHPLRASLLYELFARGSATATTLAEALDQPVNSASFHLRQLAKYGLIEDDPDAAGADGRQRWWRPAMEQGLRVHSEALESTDEGKAAVEVFRRNNVAHWHAMVDRFFGPHHGSEDTWVSSDAPVMLTKDEAEGLAAELQDVLFRWVERGRAAPEDPDGQVRRTYRVLSLLMPHQADLVD